MQVIDSPPADEHGPPGAPECLHLSRARAIDVESGAETELELVVRDGVVLDADHEPTAGKCRAVDLAGRYVVPGLIDLHTHVFAGVADCVDADAVCLARGSVTVVDAGTCGAAAIDAFAHFARGYRARVLAWLNLSTIGLVDVSVGELIPGPFLNRDGAIDAARRNEGFVVGLKARLSTYAAGSGSERVLRVLRDVADELALPVMVHVGDTSEPLEEIVEWLRPGDVVTHALTGRTNGILDFRGDLRPGIREAQQQGIRFDAARGRRHLSFEILTRAVAQAFLPDTLSTDMTTAMASDAGYGQATMANCLLACDVPLHEVVARMTAKPAAVIGGPILTKVEAGMPADLTVLERRAGVLVVNDVDGRSLEVRSPIAVAGTVRAGSLMLVGSLAA